jgi:NAD(P)-dependent dehydrogenase (short-subunit alcohol dehydrogenase family)
MLLENKNAVIYGAGGAVGGAVARAFAREGARVFLAGRTQATLDIVAHDITIAGGRAETGIVDALDGEAVEAHLDGVVKSGGSVDISFNAIDMGDAQGALLVEMGLDWFTLPINNAMRTQFLTMTAAARHMMKQGGGVVLAITANAGEFPHLNAGGFGVACAAIEGLCRQLAVEAGSSGVRVICLRSAGSPDAPGVREAFKIHAKNAGMTLEEFEVYSARDTMLKHLPKLAEVANAAAIMASDYASAMTASIANVTCGLLAD